MRALRVVAAALVLVSLQACAMVGSDPALLAWKRSATQLRELDFVRPVNFHWINRDEIPGIIGALMDEAYSPGFLERYHAAYTALGALPRDIDLRAALLELQEDQLLGLYDPASETMYVVRDDADPEYRNATVIHELVHALQHQHNPGLFELQQNLRHNDDVVTALSSALEGDASFTMLEPLAWAKRSVTTADRLRDAMLYDQENPEGLVAEAPRLLQVSLYFGYTHGPPIAARFYEAQGNAGLDAFLRTPPLSTLQAMHVDNTNPVDFIALPLELLAQAVAPQGCEISHQNVAGVLTTQVLFEIHEGDAAPPGLDALLQDWYGDRFVHVPCEGGSELIWWTRWRSEYAAAAFTTRYRAIAGSIAGAAGLAGPPRAVAEGQNVLVLTPGLEPQRALLLESAEVRGYQSLTEWMADDCFSESPCPSSPPDAVPAAAAP